MANILIAYYSESGSTERLANIIQGEVGGTLAKLDSKPDLAAYDTVFIGTPNHAAGAAQAVKEYLATADLAGKTVIPFCTHGMGGEQNTASDITALVPKSTVLRSFAVKGAEVAGAKAAVINWLTSIGLK
ncbi:MAG: hypothetical protein LBN00_06710 [Oscillospiraceae bacterium]|jgi:flavodoxin|nr:hypothetical protein [Oscillospiraceae bacterium]